MESHDFNRFVNDITMIKYLALLWVLFCDVNFGGLSLSNLFVRACISMYVWQYKLCIVSQ